MGLLTLIRVLRKKVTVVTSRVITTINNSISFATQEQAEGLTASNVAITPENIAQLRDAGLLGGGGVGALETYLHTQTDPSDTWTVEHNLDGTRHQAELIIDGELISLPFFGLNRGTNQSIITLSEMATGTAFFWKIS